MTKEIFLQITEWQKETFPKANTISKLKHLDEELKELVSAVEEESKGGSIPFEKMQETILEFADNFLLLFGAAASYGMQYEDICACIEAKMKINKARTWGKPDKVGVYKHVKEQSSRISYCAGCEAENSGIKSRIAIPHTCQ